MRGKLKVVPFFLVFAFLAISPAPSHAQAALLMEEPYGIYGALNPTGHAAIYFQRVCAETPLQLRRCQAGEQGAVISRYQGISRYDWVAIPLIPYLYSVENISDAPVHVNHATVKRIRARYHEAHLLSLGKDLPAGTFLHGGWTELVGASYDRRIYAFRFETSEKQDDAFIARMNNGQNRSHFQLLFSNCSDFARFMLNVYFPGAFRRGVFPDAGLSTPKQLASKLERYAQQHPETQLKVFEIAQIPGFRHHSRSNKSIAESLSTTAYALPLAVMSPYLAGGLAVDYLARGRYRLVPKHPEVLGPQNLPALTVPSLFTQYPVSVGLQAPSADLGGFMETPAAQTANSGLKEIKVMHE
jgi:hypothetical protein